MYKVVDVAGHPMKVFNMIFLLSVQNLMLMYVVVEISMLSVSIIKKLSCI